MPPLFFELPESKIRGIPLVFDGEHLSLGFVEVGCKPKGKPLQLKSKRQLFLKYWGDTYRNAVGWLPEVYRVVAHYDPTHTVFRTGRHAPDAVVVYHSLTEGMLAGLSLKDKEEIQHIVAKRSERRARELEKILNNCDAAAWHSMIVAKEFPFDALRGKHDMLRGKLAEILVQKDIEHVLPTGMSLYRNGDIRYFNRRYQNGTEIDGILVFWGDEPIVSLVDRLHQLEHLVVMDRWH